MSFFRRGARPSPTPSPNGSAAPILASGHNRSYSTGSNASASPLSVNGGSPGSTYDKSECSFNTDAPFVRCDAATGSLATGDDSPGDPSEPPPMPTK